MASIEIEDLCNERLVIEVGVADGGHVDLILDDAETARLASFAAKATEYALIDTPSEGESVWIAEDLRPARSA
jgi:hypothetical protein